MAFLSKDKNVSDPETASFMRDDAVGEVATLVEHGQPSLHGRTVHGDCRAIDQTPDRSRDVRGWNFMARGQYPHRFK